MRARNPREGRGWPAYIFGGRLRTTTAALLIAFCAIWWLYETYEPVSSPQQVPATEIVPPGFIPDPAYTWAPRTDVQRRAPTTTTTPTTSTPTTPTTSTAPSAPTSPTTPSAPTASGTPSETPAPSPSQGPETSPAPALPPPATESPAAGTPQPPRPTTLTPAAAGSVPGGAAVSPPQ